MATARAVLHRATSPWADTDRVSCAEWGGNQENDVVIIDDPDEDGGFNRGARITRSDAQILLLAKFFTVGARVCYPGHGEMEVVEYTYPVMRGTVTFIKTIQAFRGDGYYLVPNPLVGRKFLRVGQHGQMRAR